MPCDSGDMSGFYIDKMERATRVACEAMAIVERNGKTLHMSLEARAWWEEHQKVDRERLAREEMQRKTSEVQRKALEKLTPEERDSLGLGKF